MHQTIRLIILLVYRFLSYLRYKSSVAYMGKALSSTRSNTVGCDFLIGP